MVWGCLCSLCAVPPVCQIDAGIAKQATGWALATFSAGRMVAGLLLGWWSSRASFRTVCLTAFATNIAGQAMYLLSPLLGWGVPGIVVARLLVGAGTGTDPLRAALCFTRCGCGVAVCVPVHAVA